MGAAMLAPVCATPAEELTTSAIMPLKDATAEKGDGWVFYSYFTGDTVGTEQSLTGLAVIQPGKEIHPPHVHPEEEYLMVTQGNGVWTVNGKDTPASTGDMLYASPWESHGIKNTGDIPLKFVVMKWHSKGKPLPEQP
ncbi:cupin domain-containing protein [Alteromonas pelagimontana]|uniref:Cupin domain-containing protein n=2 Tax=Alteromonas pelagimontana TaxID=1858656 RepID=A0A6M4MJ23_9ALTE|nr:cupin domain-containing protein [Alteromonas pelagimontana]